MKLLSTSLIGAFIIVGCTTTPISPSVMALPGTNKTWEEFRADDAECREFALTQIGGQDAQSAQQSAATRTAIVGTAIGALAGLAAGGGSHQNAGTGAAVGLVGGSLAGAGAAETSENRAQQRYDNGYTQCMYAKGQQVPISGRLSQNPNYRPSVAVPSPPPPAP